MEKEDLKLLNDLVYSADHLPPIFGEGFNDGNVTWKKLQGVQFDKIGKVLVSHLIIEAYLNKYIELRGPKTFNFDNAKLSFFQKVSLIKDDPAFHQIDFVRAILAVNRIRNAFSHKLEGEINLDDIGLILTTLEEFDEKISKNRAHVSLDTHSPIAIIDCFMNIFCAYFAGMCTTITYQNNPHLGKL